jgi:hypothetical protein
MPFDNNGWNQYDALIAGTRGVSNPGTDTVQTGMGSTQARNAQSFQQPDYEARLQQMMSPYQDMANKVYGSPYAMIGKENGFLAQHLGSAAGPVDNALLAGAMTPEARGPEGVGGGISRALQGVLGANQYQRNRAMQAAMLPYQLMEPKLKALDTMAQIDQRGAAMVRADAYSQHILDQENRWQAMTANQAAKDRTLLGSDGRRYEQTANGMVDLVTRKPLDPNSNITFPDKTRAGGAGTFTERNIDKKNEELAKLDKPPLTADQELDRAAALTGIKKSVTDVADAPRVLDEQFVKTQNEIFTKSIPATMTQEQFEASAKRGNMGYGTTVDEYKPAADKDGNVDVSKWYKNYKAGMDDVRQKQSNVYSNWQRQRKMGDKVSISEYLRKNPGAVNSDYMQNPY